MPTVSSTSRGGMQPKEEPVMKSGVTTAWFHWMGVGRSTRIPRLSSSETRWSSSAFALSTVSSGARVPTSPACRCLPGSSPRVAGSDGGMQVKSARPTMTCSSGSKSFHELTTVLAHAGCPPCSNPSNRRGPSASVPENIGGMHMPNGSRPVRNEAHRVVGRGRPRAASAVRCGPESGPLRYARECRSGREESWQR